MRALCRGEPYSGFHHAENGSRTAGQIGGCQGLIAEAVVATLVAPAARSATEVATTVGRDPPYYSVSAISFGENNERRKETEQVVRGAGMPDNFRTWDSFFAPMGASLREFGGGSHSVPLCLPGVGVAATQS